MKKKVLLAMAVIMVLGSVKAMALTDDEVMDMNAATKVEAVEAMNAEMANGDLTDGKIAAVQIAEIRELNQKIDRLTSESMAEGSGLGQLSDQADRLLRQAEATEDSAEINKLWIEAKELNETVLKIQEFRSKQLTIEQEQNKI